MKSEPACFSIDDLANSPRQTTCWSGVRNYQARNFMREMQKGDRVLFYHSSTLPPAVVGVAVVVKEAYPDHTAWDQRDDHFDPKASPENQIWQMVDIKLDKIFPRAVSIGELRSVKQLKSMELLRRGSRLSVQSVTSEEFQTIVRLSHSIVDKSRN
ncbi:MAG: EVE domain-containing protein [Pirellulales bacterium]|nr:EVE domain-containing protein [Pirellulales bacterium]